MIDQEFPSNEYYKPSIDELKMHKIEIMGNLKKFDNLDSNKFRKYHWLGQYHNYFCSEYFCDEPSLIIDEISTSKIFSYPFE